MVVRIGPKNPRYMKVYLYEWRTRPKNFRTLEQVAEMIGTSKSTVQRMEVSTREPNLGYLAAFAEALDIEVSDIFRDPNRPSQEEIRAMRAEEQLREARNILDSLLPKTGT